MPTAWRHLENAQQSVSDIKMYQEGHGGVRVGAGRPSGARNKRPTYQAVKAMMVGEQSPLDFLLDVMRDDRNDVQLRVMAAKAAAPYIHRQLKSVEQTGEGGGPQRVVVNWDMTGMLPSAAE